MPCSDGGPSYEQTQEPRRVAAVLCGILTHIEAKMKLDVFLAGLDWEEIGITQAWAEGWWAEHKAEDVRRRAWEAEANRVAEIRAAALNRLTPDERRALGVSSREEQS